MADLDTASKRGSSLGMAMPPRLQLPVPSGTPSQANRQEVAFSYAGILAAAPGGTSLMTQTRSQFRMMFAKIFDRMF